MSGTQLTLNPGVSAMAIAHNYGMPVTTGLVDCGWFGHTLARSKRNLRRWDDDDLTAYGTPVIAADPNDWYVTLKGNLNYYEFADPQTATESYAFVVKTDDTMAGSTTRPTLAGNGGSAASGGGFQLYNTGISGSDATIALRVAVEGGGTPAYLTTSRTVPNFNLWKLLIAVIDDVAHTLTLYNMTDNTSSTPTTLTTAVRLNASLAPLIGYAGAGAFTGQMQMRFRARWQGHALTSQERTDVRAAVAATMLSLDGVTI